MNECGRCGFPTTENLKNSVLEPWITICPICHRAEQMTLARQKEAKTSNNKGLPSFLKTETIINSSVKNMFRGAFKIKTEKKEEEIVKDEPIQEDRKLRQDRWWISEEPIRRVPGTQYVMERFKGFGGNYYLNEEAKNILSLADIRSYQGKKRQVTAGWLLENFTNNGDVVLDPFSGSGMFSLVAKTLGREPIAFDILRSAVASTKALISTPSRRAILKTGQEIVEASSSIKIETSDYPKAILKWYDLDAFRSGARHLRCIQDELIPMDTRMADFQTQIALYILQRNSYGRGGYSWRIDEKEFRKRSLWDKDQGKEYLRHIKKVTRNPDPSQYNTSHKAYQQSVLEETPLETGSVDRIVTDPPYGDMINYIAQVWVEEWYLGWKDIVTMDELLKVSATPKKGLEFAHKHMIQDVKTFFTRMELAMKEMYRVLRSDGTATFIIGDFKETKKIGNETVTVKINPFRPLEKIARRIGFEEVYAINKPFKRQSTYKHTHAGEQKFERIIIFRKGIKQDDLPIDRVIEKRKVGLEKFFQ